MDKKQWQFSVLNIYFRRTLQKTWAKRSHDPIVLPLSAPPAHLLRALLSCTLPPPSTHSLTAPRARHLSAIPKTTPTSRADTWTLCAILWLPEHLRRPTALLRKDSSSFVRLLTRSPAARTTAFTDALRDCAKTLAQFSSDAVCPVNIGLMLDPSRPPTIRDFSSSKTPCGNGFGDKHSTSCYFSPLFLTPMARGCSCMSCRPICPSVCRSAAAGRPSRTVLFVALNTRGFKIRTFCAGRDDCSPRRAREKWTSRWSWPCYDRQVAGISFFALWFSLACAG